VPKGILHVPSFESGVVFAGSGDVQAATELRVCDNLDIGVRGQLQSAPTPINFLQLVDQQAVPAPIARAFGVTGARFGKANAQAILAGLGKKLGGADRYFFCQMGVESSVAGASQVQQTWLITDVAGADFVPPVVSFNAVNYTQDPQMTAAPFSYVSGAGASHPNLQMRLLFICLGARYPSLSPRDMPGLYVMVWDGGGYGFWPIGLFDALGTGPLGEFNTGNKAVQLYFRGIAAYNNHLFGFGFDNAESASGESPNRLMFSNVGNPLKWGNDNQAAAGANRFFTDSDAITVGGSGEVITALCSSRGRLWIGTNRGLHYLAGYGRDSFITDGTTAIAKSMDVVGPNALCEGPDGVLYGVGSKGLWSYRGGLVPSYAASRTEVELIFDKLRLFDDTSPGYFDFMNAGSVIPGSFVIDRIWLRSDKKRQQVWMVIPGVNAAAGNGAGNDTIVIKYHTRSGGFTRQIILGKIWMPGFDFDAGTTVVDHVIIPQSGDVQTTVDFGAVAPASGQVVRFGPYAPFGPDQQGVCRVMYIVCSWPDAGALPIVFTVQPILDGVMLAVNNVTIAPVAPVAPGDGDTWLDTSGTDTNLGNASGDSIVPITNSYVQKRWKTSWNKWVYVSRGGGQLGTRVTIPIPFQAFPSVRVEFLTTVSSAERIQIEGIGMGASQPE
jgi:hypothetical protein